MSRRPLPPVPTTSWSDGRSARRRTPAPPRPRSRTRSLGFFLPLRVLHEGLDEPPEMLMVGEEGTVEDLGAVALDEDGGEVLHLPLAELRGVVLDVEPAKARAGEFLRQLEEAFAVRFAAIAPQGANTGDIHGDIQGRVHRCPILFTRSPE